MTLVLAQTRNILSRSPKSSLVPLLQHAQFLTAASLKWAPARHHNVLLIRCCAAPLENEGPLDAESRDGAGNNILAHAINGTSTSSGASESTLVVTTASESGSAMKQEEANQTAGEERWVVRTENRIERAIFDFRFLTLMATGGSLVGSLLCFLKGCGFVYDAYVAYIAIHLTGKHNGQVILRLVEAVEIYLVGTVMLIFAMGLFGLFISNESQDGSSDRAMKNTTLFGMFALRKRPLWMQITSLDTLKTKLGHCIVMILIVKLFEKSKTVCIASSTDLLWYSVTVFLAAASLYVLQQLHASQFSSKPIGN